MAYFSSFASHLGLRADLTIPNVPSRMGLRSVSIHTDKVQKDGTVVWLGLTDMLIGTRPLSEKEEAGREARLRVREGMQDVLEWLGPNAPRGSHWYNEPRGVEILDWIKGSCDPMGIQREFGGVSVR